MPSEKFKKLLRDTSKLKEAKEICENAGYKVRCNESSDILNENEIEVDLSTIGSCFPFNGFSKAFPEGTKLKNYDLTDNGYEYFEEGNTSVDGPFFKTVEFTNDDFEIEFELRRNRGYSSDVTINVWSKYTGNVEELAEALKKYDLKLSDINPKSLSNKTKKAFEQYEFFEYCNRIDGQEW